MMVLVMEFGPKSLFFFSLGSNFFFNLGYMQYLYCFTAKNERVRVIIKRNSGEQLFVIKKLNQR